MSAFEFLGKMGIARIGKLGDSITSALVQFDPETASQVEIDNMTQHSREIAGRIAEAEPKEEHDHQRVTELTIKLNRTKQAAQVLGGQLQAAQEAGNAALATTVTASLTALLGQIEELGGEEGDGSKAGTLFDAIQDHVQSEADLHEWQQVHAGTIAALTTARSRLDKAKRDMLHASEQEQRAHERQAQIERDAGLKSGLNTGNIALSAMQQAAEESKKRARAAMLNADALKQASSTSTSADDIVAQTLAAQAPSPVSALDRLAKLTGKT